MQLSIFLQWLRRYSVKATMVSWLVTFLVYSTVVLASPITNPLRSDEDIGNVLPEYFDSKRTKNFHTFTPNESITAQEITSNIDAASWSEFKLRWSTTVGSPVYSSPVIFPSGPHGKKQIYVNTFYQYAELLDGDGYKAWGWPLSFEDSSFQGSPMLYDVDGDGNMDMGLVDKNANMYWVRIGEFGEYLEDYHIQVPKLRVKRDWAEGLDPQFVDAYVKLSMFDRQPGQQQQQRFAGGAPGANGKVRLDDLQTIKSGGSSGNQQGRRRLSEEGPQDGEFEPDFGEGGGMDDFVRTEAERMAAGENMYGGGLGEESGGEGGEGSGDSGDVPASVGDVMGADAAGSAETAEGEGEGSPDGSYEYAYRAAPGRAHGGQRTGYGAGAAYYGGGLGGGINETDYVMVDAHVLASPVLVDINGDGHMEVLVSVSYYYDKADYAGRGAEQLGFDPDMFVAGGVACWDLDEQRWTWLVHLDLTTAKSKFQAMIYAPPTVADLDGDGRKEVIVGTAMGLLYVMDGESGFVRRFFPMQFHSIQAQVSVADVTGSRDLEMIVLDMGGTVAVVDLNGDIVWDAQLSGTLPFPATVGDVDGDGQLDVVVVAATPGKGSHVYALRGDTGAVLDGYPIALPGQAAVSAPVLLVDLQQAAMMPPLLLVSMQHGASNGSVPISKEPAGVKLRKTPPASTLGTLDDPFLAETLAAGAPPSRNSEQAKRGGGLHLVITSFEGSVYIVRGTPLDVPAAANAMMKSLLDKKLGTGPAGRFHAQRIDVGEHIYCVPLLDDVTGDGFLDLVVGTLNGQVLLFESTVPHHPINSWPSFPKHRLNSVTHGQIGVSVPYEEKQKLALLDIKGSKHVNIVFEIWDSRYKSEQPGAQYSVSITKGTNRLNPVWSHTFDKPGRYVAVVPVTPPELALFVVSLQSDHGEYFEDTVHVALSTRFYIWLKYLLVTPMVLICFTMCSKLRKHIW